MTTRDHYYVSAEDMTIYREDNHGQVFDLNAEGEDCASFADLREFAQELHDQGAYGTDVLAALIDEIDDAEEDRDRDGVFYCVIRNVDGTVEREIGSDLTQREAAGLLLKYDDPSDPAVYNKSLEAIGRSGRAYSHRTDPNGRASLVAN